MIGVGVGQTYKAIGQAFGKQATKTIANQTVFKTLGKGFLGEAFEEGTSAFLDPVYQRMTYNPSAENASPEEIAYAAFVGGMSGMLMSGGGHAINKGASLINGNKIANTAGETEKVLKLGEYWTNFEEKNKTGLDVYSNISEKYNSLRQSLASTNGVVSTAGQKIALDELNRATVAGTYTPLVLKEATRIAENAPVVAERMNVFGYKTPDGKPITFTAEQLRAGIDLKNPKSIATALKTNQALLTLSTISATGHLMMDTARFEQATLMGKRLASQVDLNRFIETATPSEINAVSQALGIENWVMLDVDTFNQKITSFVENGGVQQYADRRATVQTIQSIPAETARPMPKMVNLRQDGSVRYSDGSTQIAITKQGDAYTVYDYASGHLSKNMTRSEVNKLLRDYNTQQADILAGARAQMEAESELRRQAEELDTYARENIADYSKLSSPNQSMIRKVIREGRAKGMTDEDVLTYAKISAHAGIDIVFDKQATFRGHDEAGNEKYADGFYDPKTNRIVVNPDSKRTHERLLIHELEHAILKDEGGRNLIETAFKNMDSETRNRIVSRYGDFYRGSGLDAAQRIDIMNDEISAHYAEEILSNRNTLEKLVEAEPTLKDKILSFFKGASKDYESVPKLSKAARRYYKTYKKLFDSFAARNQGNNALSIALEGAGAKKMPVTNTEPDSVHVTGDNDEEAPATTNTDVDTDTRYAIKYPNFSEADISSNMDAIADMETVATIDASKLEKTGKSPMDTFNEYFSSLGNNIASDTFGDIALPKSSAKSEIRHGITAEKIASIEAIPAVIEQGKVIFHKAKEGGVERIVVCAPIKIGEADYYMGVMLQRDARYQRLYLHNVVSVAIEREATSSSKDNLVTTGALENENHLSITSIIQKALNVKAEKQKSAKKPAETSSGKRFALDVDSEGTQLTEAQQEFFKSSKVRDSKGRLLVMYHGTTVNFNTFKKGDVGFHFGTKAAARGRVGYGKNAIMKRVHLNITNPIVFEEDLGSWDADYRLTQELFERDILTREEVEQVLLSDDKSYRRTTEKANKKLAETLLQKGYDGIAYSNTFETKKPTTSYIAFQSNQAKVVENETPTSNPDIRYALSETRGSIMTEVDPEYKPTIQDKAFSGWTAAQIAFTNAQAGIEAVGKKYGVRNIESLVQAARSGRNQAEEMIAGNQWRIGSDSKTYQGEGLEQIFRPIARQGEEVKGDFFDYLFNYHNMSRMTLEQRSMAEQQTRLDDIKKKVAALKKFNKRIEKFQADIKALGRTKKDMETKRGLREELAKAKAESKALKKEVTELEKAAKAFVPLENKAVLGTTDEHGIETVVTAEQSEAIVKKYEEAHPEFKRVAEKVWAFLQNLNQYRVDTGLISQDTFDYLAKLYPHYVPTYRTGATKGIGAIEGKYNLKVKTTIKTAKGSTKKLLPPDVMIARQVMETVRAGRINQLANALYEGAEKSGDTTYIEIVSRERATNESLAELDPTEIRPKNNEVVFFRDGERITMRVSKEIFAGFNAFNPEVEIHNPLVNGARAINNGFKRLVTSLNPAFLLRNTIRDVQDAGINTKYGKTFLKNYARASYEISHNGKLWQLYKAMGGFSSSVFDFEKGFSGMQNKWGLTKAEGNLLKQTLQGVENANAFVEQLPRLAEFISSIEAGNSAEQAILDSADVTTNFGRMGNITKVLNRTLIPFLNPSIQGCSKMIRNITSIRSAREFASLAFKAALVGVAPMVLNMLMYEDDEDYKNLRDNDKENNFLFKVGDTFVKIPRGRVASVIGGLVNRGKSAAEGEDVDWAGYVKNIMQQVTPVDSMSRTIFSPFSDVANNLTWYGSAIEGRQFENTAPKDRYDENTSSIAIAIGQLINYSPKKIHYLLDQYSGVIGDFILPATTAKAEKDFLSGNFTLDPATSNKLSTEFYEMYDQAQYAKTAGDDTAAYQVRYLNKVKSAISDMYKQKSEIQNNPDLSNTEKLQQTRVVQLLINEAYKTALQDFELYTKAIKATAGMEDENLRFTEATRLMYGAERALSEYNDDVYAKCQMLNKAGVDYETLYNYYFTVRGMTSDKDYQGNTISGSKRAKVVSSIKSMDISADQKLLLICASGYALQDNDLPRMSADIAKKRLLRYILNLKGTTQAEKTELAEMCGFEVKNGRVVVKTPLTFG